MNQTALSQARSHAVTIGPGRLTARKSLASRPNSSRSTLVLNAVMVVALVLAASLGARGLVERRSGPDQRQGIFAASSQSDAATPGPLPGAPTLVWAASDLELMSYLLSVPISVAVGPGGDVYVLDAEVNIAEHFSANGRDRGTWVESMAGQVDGISDHALNLHDAENDSFNGGMSFDADGNAYVFDSYNNRILKFDDHGAFLIEWGSSGGGSGQFDLPVGTVDAQNALVYVADYRNNRVQVFDLEGNFLDKWGSEGAQEGQFNHPSAIAVGLDGSVYVGEDEGRRIQHFDRNGRYLGQIGRSQLGYIYGLAVDGNGNVLASAGPEGTVWVFAPDGTEIARITEIAGLDSMGFPTGIAVAPDGSILLAIAPPELYPTSEPSGDLINFTIPALSSGS
jgi:DNA-binding beta-propeller fold protein YncE